MPSKSNLGWGEMRAEKFGKVIFSSQQDGDDVTDDQQRLDLVSPILFSSLDGKWYSGGNKEAAAVREVNALNKDNSVSLTFPFSVEDQYGKAISREMTFLLPEKLGELVEPNLELVANGAERMVEQAFRAGYTREEIKTTFEGLETMPAFMGVGKGSEGGDILLHVMWQMVFVVDDILERGNKEEYKRYDHLAKIISHFVDLLRGNEPSVEGMSELAATVVKKHQLFFRLLREDAIHAAEKFGGDPTPALEAFAECLASVLVELSLEWNAKRSTGSAAFLRLQRANREIASAVIPTLEVYALVEGISVREEIRRSFLFKQFNLLVAQHVTLTNDIFSYSKEVANGEASNILYLHHVEEGLSMGESLARIEMEVNQVSQAMVELGELLVQLYSEEDEGLARYVKLGKDVTCGHLRWSSYSQRYCPDLWFDMIVHN